MFKRKNAGEVRWCLFFLWLFLLTVFYPFTLVYGAEASINVAPDQTFYRDIEKLIAHKLIKKSIWGQRPYSRQEFARLILEAKKNFLQQTKISESGSNYIRDILDRLEREFKDEIFVMEKKGSRRAFLFHPLTSVQFGGTMTNSPFRVVPENGGGHIDARVNPFLDSQMGHHLAEGTTTSLQTDSSLQWTDHVALHLIPRFQLAWQQNDNPEANAFIENFYAKFFLKNIELEIGRDNVLWGQGDTGSLFLSTNPRALDLVKISNDKPFLLPWVFKNLGLQKMSFMYADLGPEQNFSHAYLATWKWSLLPMSFLEFGFVMGVHSGGEGAPGASFGQRVLDIFPVTHLLWGSQDLIGNKIGGGDFHLRLPFLRNTTLYGEILFDDIKGDLKTQFDDVAAYLFGLYAPRLLDSGKLDLRLEYHQVGTIFYRHGQFQSGWTENQFVLGDPLGSDSWGIYATANWDLSKNNSIKTAFAWETASGDIYMGVAPVGANSFFEKITDNPEETRYRATLVWGHYFKKLNFMNFNLKGGYERVKNFNFSSGSSLNNFLGQFTLVIKPVYN